MEYYILKSNVRTLVEPVLLQGSEYPYRMTDENFDRMPPASTGYYEYKNNIIIPDIMNKPTFMVSDTVKEAIDIYDESIEWKKIFVMPNYEKYLQKGIQEYNIPKLIKVECLSEDVKLLPNGTVENLIIDSRRVTRKDIFQIANIQENVVVVSLRLAESILRRNQLGVRFERVEVRQ